MMDERFPRAWGGGDVAGEEEEEENGRFSLAARRATS